MPAPCAICTSPHRAAIEADLAEGATYRAVAKRWEVSKSSLGRHRRHPPAPNPASNLIPEPKPEPKLPVEEPSPSPDRPRIVGGVTFSVGELPREPPPPMSMADYLYQRGWP